LLSFEQLIRGS